MGFLEDRDRSELPTIPDFYKEKTIFITGGTGFMGQALIEKLLYSCGDLKQIVLLMRPKKGSTSDERVANLYKSDIFSRLKKEKPGLYERKVKAVTGDIERIELGLSKEEREYLKNEVNIVFHSAASVKFNDDLPTATRINLRSARELIILAKEMKNLLAYVHVSTCYCNHNYGKYIEEKLYPPHADWKETIEICEKLEGPTLNNVTKKYIGDLQNTYVFTKQLAEALVSEQKGKLPAIIIRPSIVVSTVEEPTPGWIAGFNGISGLVAGGACGVVKDIPSDPDLPMDFIPVDYCIRHFIAAAWIRGTKVLEPTDEVEFYNCSSSGDFKMTLGRMNETGKKILYDYPLEHCISVPSVSYTNSYKLHYVKFLLYQLIPAIVIDTVLWLMGKNTRLVKIQRRIYQANIALNFFMSNAWEFDNKNFKTLRSRLKEEDRKCFNYDLTKVDVDKYIQNSYFGGKQYLFKEQCDDFTKARNNLFRLKIINYVWKAVVVTFLLWKFVNLDYFSKL